MRSILALLISASLAQSAFSQTVRDVVAGTNGVLVSPTNFFATNLPPWSVATNSALARTNLGLGTTNNVEFRGITANGNATFGDASGDTVTINAGTVTAPNATNTAPTDVANVGALDGRYISPLANYIYETPTDSIYRYYTNGGTAAATVSSVSAGATTNQGSYGIAYCLTYQGATVSVNSSNKKVFGELYGWWFVGFLSCRPVGCITRFVVGGAGAAADYIAAGTLPYDGIALESRSLVASSPMFRLVVRSGATTSVGEWSAANVISYAVVADWWIVLSGGYCYAYARINRTGAWTLLCSVATAVPGSYSDGNGFAFVACTPDAGAGGAPAISATRIYETFGLKP